MVLYHSEHFSFPGHKSFSCKWKTQEVEMVLSFTQNIFMLPWGLSWWPHNLTHWVPLLDHTALMINL